MYPFMIRNSQQTKNRVELIQLKRNIYKNLQLTLFIVVKNFFLDKTGCWKDLPSHYYVSALY